MIRIATVKYINTLPFLQAIESNFESSEVAVSSLQPAQCAEVFRNGEADLALVPIGALNDIPPHEIITDYCIGSFGPVDTVALMSNDPLNHIDHIVLDSHSRTSNILIKLLCEEFWKISPEFHPVQSGDIENPAYLFIGDKVKNFEPRFEYKFDLGDAWTNWTGMPMVYAVWVASPNIDTSFIDHLNVEFKKSISTRHTIQFNGLANPSFWRNYLVKTIRYNFDEKAKSGMNHFLKLSKMVVHEI